MSLGQMPIENLCPVPGRDAGPRENFLERALHVADTVGHARQVRMHRDRHEFRPRRRFGVEPLELVHDATVHLDRRMVLQRHHDDVVQLEIVRQGDHRLVGRLERDRLVVEHPVADIFDAGGGKMIERVERLRQPRPEPAARRLAPELGDDGDRLVDHRLLVVELVHRHLVELAAQAAREKLFEAAAEKMEVGVEELEAKNGRIRIKGSLERGMSFKEAIKFYQYSDRPMPVIGRGSYQPPAKEPTTLLKEDGNFSPAYSFMTQAAEVEVNTKTGKVKVLRVVASHDCGKAINPMLVEGQLEGSVVGGMGQALYEEVITEKGQVLNPSFLDYGIPTAMEIPSITSVEVETNDPEGPFGAKESGEGTQLAPAPAIINAIYDAIGVRFKTLPVTPEKILRALDEKKNE